MSGFLTRELTNGKWNAVPCVGTARQIRRADAGAPRWPSTTASSKPIGSPITRLRRAIVSSTASGSRTSADGVLRPKQRAKYPPVNRPYLTHEAVYRDGNYPVPPGVDVVVEKSQLGKRRPADDFVQNHRGVSQYALHAFSPFNLYVRLEVLETSSVVGFPRK